MKFDLSDWTVMRFGQSRPRALLRIPKPVSTGVENEVWRDTVNSKTNRSAQVRLIQAIPSPTLIHT